MSLLNDNNPSPVSMKSYSSSSSSTATNGGSGKPPIILNPTSMSTEFNDSVEGSAAAAAIVVVPGNHQLSKTENSKLIN